MAGMELLAKADALVHAGGIALLLAARQGGHGRGSHGRRRPGEGDAFWQFRDYRAGDAPHRIDWRRSARTSQLYVREREWEAAQTLYLWADSSPSMHFSGAKGRTSKATRAALIGLGLAVMANEAGERLALLGDPAGHGRTQLSRIAAGIDGRGREFPALQTLATHGHVLILSDFLDPVAVWQARLQALRQAGLRVHLIQVLDPVEEDFPYQGRTQFCGLEDEAPLTLGRAEDVAFAYKRALQARIEHLRDLARHQGWSLLRHRCDAAPLPCLLSAAALMRGR